MAESTIAASKVSANFDASNILVMHRRYETAWEEYNRLDIASNALRTHDANDQALEYHYGGKLVNNAETDALRRAILYQVPTTWTEAMVLLFHTHSAHGLSDKPSPEEYAATEIAMDTLLDFMCCEVEQDHEELGKQFQAIANTVFDKRRHRTGVVAA